MNIYNYWFQKIKFDILKNIKSLPMRNIKNTNIIAIFFAINGKDDKGCWKKKTI